MDASVDKDVELTDLGLKITRLIHAPQAMVWRAFTDARHIHNWWGPNGFTTTTSEMDVRVGGMWRYVMHGPDGTDYVNWIRYSKVQMPSMLEYAHGGDDPDHAVFHARIEIVAKSATQTLVTLGLIFDSNEQRDAMANFGAIEGGRQNLARCAAFMAHAAEHASGAMTLTLTSPTEFIVTRDFKATREQVFNAWTTPEHVRQWYGHCDKMTMTSCDIDLRVEGKWRYVLRMNEGGSEHAFSGEYQVIDRPNRLVYNERYEQIPGTDHIVTLTLIEREGVTTLSIHSRYSSQEMRDGHVQSGMEAGMRQTLDQLAALVESQA